MNDEQHALDMIEELMAAACDENGVPLDDYNKERYVKCELGQHDWHGTPNDTGCPGAWATDEQKQAFQAGDGDYSKSVAGPTIRMLRDGAGDRFVAIYQGSHVVHGTVTFAPGENAVIATFTPDTPFADLILYDEANNLNPPMPQGFRDVGYIGDTP